MLSPIRIPSLAVHAAKATPPDYLVSDIVMPGMTGIELAIALQREVPTCKVLLFSGEIGASELIKNASAEGHSFELLQKPVHPKELVEAIRNL